MNNTQRKEVHRIQESLAVFTDAESVKEAGAEEVAAALEEAANDIQAVSDEEQEKYDNLPENFQNGERGEAMQEAIDILSSAENTLSSISIDPENLDEDWADGVADEVQSAIDELSGI